MGDVGRDRGVKMSLEYDPQAGNIQHFLKISGCNGLDSAYMR